MSDASTPDLTEAERQAGYAAVWPLVTAAGRDVETNALVWRAVHAYADAALAARSSSEAPTPTGYEPICGAVDGPNGVGGPCALPPGHGLHRDGIEGEWAASPEAPTPAARFQAHGGSTPGDLAHSIAKKLEEAHGGCDADICLLTGLWPEDVQEVLDLAEDGGAP